MDPLSIFLNLLAKTEGRDKVHPAHKLVLATYPVRHSQLQSQQRPFCRCIRSNQNDQESIEIPEDIGVLGQGETGSS
jgi:hypothetical protein